MRSVEIRHGITAQESFININVCAQSDVRLGRKELRDGDLLTAVELLESAKWRIAVAERVLQEMDRED